MENSQHETIFSTPHGNLFHLTETNLYQLDFGNMVITLKKKNIRSLYDFLISTNPKLLEALKVLPSNKILIQPCGFWGCYAFTENQFLELRELVIGSYNLIQLEEEIYEALTQK